MEETKIHIDKLIKYLFSKKDEGTEYLAINDAIVMVESAFDKKFIKKRKKKNIKKIKVHIDELIEYFLFKKYAGVEYLTTNDIVPMVENAFKEKEEYESQWENEEDE